MTLFVHASGQDINKSFGLTVSLPWLNNYSYYDYQKNSSQKKSGFIGFGLGLFYTHVKNKISLNAGVTADSPMPLGVEYAKEGTLTKISSTFIELIYHRQILKKLNGIIGVNMTSYNFNLTSFVDSVSAYHKTDNTFGLTIGAEYIFTKHISLATFYRPTIDNNLYRHLISVDLRFNFDIWKK